MMGPPPVSVIVPAYNCAPTIEACLRALLHALPDGGEIIVVDDLSTDGTAEIVARLPVRLLRHDRNGGPSATRNTGWQASRSDLVAFVDSDVYLLPDALGAMLAHMEDPAVLGVNGVLSLDCPHADPVSDFVNGSIHFQHLRHGDRVSSTFTSLCLLRREILVSMGGWSEVWYSRYADDVSTRFVLPPGCIVMEPRAQGRHDKAVTLRGLIKHRVNVGFFFLRSIGVYRDALRARPHRGILHHRYPVNTLLAAITLLCLALLGFRPLVALAGLGLAGLLFLGVNMRFSAFLAGRRGVGLGLLCLPLSALEGFAYLAGMTLAALTRA